jgi:hypothetical protein
MTINEIHPSRRFPTYHDVIGPAVVCFYPSPSYDLETVTSVALWISAMVRELSKKP